MAKRSISTRDGVTRYYLDGEEVSREKWHEDWHVKVPNYAKGECPRVKPDLDDFSSENSGRGRFNDQLGTYVKSTRDTIDQAKRRGWRAMG